MVFFSSLDGVLPRLIVPLFVPMIVPMTVLNFIRRGLGLDGVHETHCLRFQKPLDISPTV
jgi:hypothetical protein